MGSADPAERALNQRADQAGRSGGPRDPSQPAGVVKNLAGARTRLAILVDRSATARGGGAPRRSTRSPLPRGSTWLHSRRPSTPVSPAGALAPSPADPPAIPRRRRSAGRSGGPSRDRRSRGTATPARGAADPTAGRRGRTGVRRATGGRSTAPSCCRCRASPLRFRELPAAPAAFRDLPVGLPLGPGRRVPRGERLDRMCWNVPVGWSPGSGPGCRHDAARWPGEASSRTG